jgi:NTP pyrophosphatase (non-canonical NTP hydrolase)
MKKLQEFQRRFDEKHFKYSELTEDTKLLYLALALCGETGELANLVKKFQRKKHLHPTADKIDEESFKRKASEEMADILAYLLLLSNLLKIDLEKEYYNKMEKNKEKFKND